jgi:hypothetical protein
VIVIGGGGGVEPMPPPPPPPPPQADSASISPQAVDPINRFEFTPSLPDKPLDFHDFSYLVDREQKLSICGKFQAR